MNNMGTFLICWLVLAASAFSAVSSFPYRVYLGAHGRDPESRALAIAARDSIRFKILVDKTCDCLSREEHRILDEMVKKDGKSLLSLGVDLVVTTQATDQGLTVKLDWRQLDKELTKSVAVPLVGGRPETLVQKVDDLFQAAGIKLVTDDVPFLSSVTYYPLWQKGLAAREALATCAVDSVEQHFKDAWNAFMLCKPDEYSILTLPLMECVTLLIQKTPIEERAKRVEKLEAELRNAHGTSSWILPVIAKAHQTAGDWQKASNSYSEYMTNKKSNGTIIRHRINSRARFAEELDMSNLPKSKYFHPEPICYVAQRGRVAAIKIHSGEEIWSFNYPGTRKLNTFFHGPTTLLLYDKLYYVVADRKSGKVRHEIPIAQPDEGYSSVRATCMDSNERYACIAVTVYTSPKKRYFAQLVDLQKGVTSRVISKDKEFKLGMFDGHFIAVRNGNPLWCFDPKLGKEVPVPGGFDAGKLVTSELVPPATSRLRYEGTSSSNRKLVYKSNGKPFLKDRVSWGVDDGRYAYVFQGKVKKYDVETGKLIASTGDIAFGHMKGIYAGLPLGFVRNIGYSFINLSADSFANFLLSNATLQKSKCLFKLTHYEESLAQLRLLVQKGLFTRTASYVAGEAARELNRKRDYFLMHSNYLDLSQNLACEFERRAAVRSAIWKQFGIRHVARFRRPLAKKLHETMHQFVTCSPSGIVQSGPTIVYRKSAEPQVITDKPALSYPAVVRENTLWYGTGTDEYTAKTFCQVGKAPAVKIEGVLVYQWGDKALIRKGKDYTIVNEDGSEVLRLPTVERYSYGFRGFGKYCLNERNINCQPLVLDMSTGTMATIESELRGFTMAGQTVAGLKGNTLIGYSVQSQKELWRTEPALKKGFYRYILKNCNGEHLFLLDYRSRRTREEAEMAILRCCDSKTGNIAWEYEVRGAGGYSLSRSNVLSTENSFILASPTFGYGVIFSKEGEFLGKYNWDTSCRFLLEGKRNWQYFSEDNKWTVVVQKYSSATKLRYHVVYEVDRIERLLNLEPQNLPTTMQKEDAVSNGQRLTTTAIPLEDSVIAMHRVEGGVRLVLKNGTVQTVDGMGDTVTQYDFKQPLGAAAFCPRTNTLAAVGKDGVILVETNGWTRKELPQKRSVRLLAISSDGKYIAIGDKNRKVSILNSDTGKGIVEFDVNRLPRRLEFSLDGRVLYVIGAGRTIQRYEIVKKALLKPLEGHSFSPNRILELASGNLLSGGHDLEIKTWNAETWKAETTYSAHAALITGLVRGEDGEFFSSSLDGKVIRWKTGAVKPIGTISMPGGGIRHMVFGREKKLLACVCSDGVLRFVNLEKKNKGIAFEEMFTY